MLPFPDQALEQHTIALGKTGSGKSSKLRLAVERMLDANTPVVIIDPKGDWWGLKSSADGKKAGYPVVIFGGDHADVPINRDSGPVVGELLATGNRPAIVDLGGWTVGDRTKFFIAFAGSFFKHARGARVLVIDEAHNFAPQARVHDPQAGMMLHWANRLASEGRGKGITLLSASQRPQKVHKDYVTSHETLIACRVIHPRDRQAIKDWVDGCGDPTLGKQMIDALAGMKRTDAWVWSPEIEFGPAQLTFPMFSTYDSFKPQAADTGRLKGWASVDLGEVTEKLAREVEERKANDPVELRKRIAELERQMREASAHASKQGQIPDPEAIQQAYRNGYQQGATAQLEAAHLDYLRTLSGLPVGPLLQAMDALAGAIVKAQERKVTLIPVTPAAGAPPIRQIPRSDKPVANSVKFDQDRPLGAERQPLKVLAGMHPAGMTEAAWAVGSVLKRTGGTWKTYLSRLRSAGRIEERGGEFFITQQGLDDLGEVPVQPPAPGPALIAFWADKIPGAGPMLRRLGEVYPAWRSEDELAADLDLAASGGTFKTYLSRLRSPGLIETDQKQVRAAPSLMG